MITRTAASILALTLLAHPGPAAAQTLIAPGQTFLLGGEQRQPVQLEGRNVGAVAVDLLRMTASGEVLLVRAEPGKAFAAQLPAGETALARNTSVTQTARLRFVFNGQIDGLSMRYDRPAR